MCGSQSGFATNILTGAAIRITEGRSRPFLITQMNDYIYFKSTEKNPLVFRELLNSALTEAGLNNAKVTKGEDEGWETVFDFDGNKFSFQSRYNLDDEYVSFLYRIEKSFIFKKEERLGIENAVFQKVLSCLEDIKETKNVNIGNET